MILGSNFCNEGVCSLSIKHQASYMPMLLVACVKGVIEGVSTFETTALSKFAKHCLGLSPYFTPHPHPHQDELDMKMVLYEVGSPITACISIEKVLPPPHTHQQPAHR